MFILHLYTSQYDVQLWGQTTLHLYTSQYDVQLWGQTTLHLYTSQYDVQVWENGYTAPVHKSVWCTGVGKWLHTSSHLEGL